MVAVQDGLVVSGIATHSSPRFPFDRPRSAIWISDPASVEDHRPVASPGPNPVRHAAPDLHPGPTAPPDGFAI